MGPQVHQFNIISAIFMGRIIHINSWALKVKNPWYSVDSKKKEADRVDGESWKMSARQTVGLQVHYEKWYCVFAVVRQPPPLQISVIAGWQTKGKGLSSAYNSWEKVRLDDICFCFSPLIMRAFSGLSSVIQTRPLSCAFKDRRNFNFGTFMLHNSHKDTLLNLFLLAVQFQ